MKDGPVDEEFLESVREKDPVDQDGLRDWAESEAGRQVYARIVARRDSEPGRRASGARRFRVLVVAAGVVAAAAAIAAGVILATQGGPGTVVESTTTTAAGPEQAVDRVAALYGVVVMTEGVPGAGMAEQPSNPDEAESLVEMAQSLGVVTQAEREFAVTSGPVSRGMYALWVWRSLGGHLAKVREASFPDVNGLSDEMRAAVTGVYEAGILDLSPGGQFEPMRSLTLAEELAARSRIETALGSRPGG